MRKALVFGLIAVLLLAACGSSSTSSQTASVSDLPAITVYKSPT